MQIKRSPDDREGQLDAQRSPYAFEQHFDDELVVAVEDERPTRIKPEQLGCDVIHANRTDRGLAEDCLRSFWEDSQKSKMTKLIGGTFGGTFVINNIYSYR